MTSIPLDGYRPIKNRWPVYLLDTASGSVETRWFENQADGKKSGPKCGQGDFRETGGLGKKHAGFVAMYANEGSLHLWLDGRDVNLEDSNVVVKRSTDFLLRKHFRVLVNGEVVFETRYSYLDHEDFPDRDIFWYIARSLVDPEQRRRALLIWEDQAKGIDQSTSNYFQDLNYRLKGANNVR